MPDSQSRRVVKLLVEEIGFARPYIRDVFISGESFVSRCVQQSLSEELGREVTAFEAIEVFSHSLVMVRSLAALHPDEFEACYSWYSNLATKWEGWAMELGGSDPLEVSCLYELQASARSTRASPRPHQDSAIAGRETLPLTRLYEHVLRREQPDRRKRAGVFYTPQPIVRHMLRQIDAQLREEFSLPLGLADEATWGQVRRQAPSLALPRGASDCDPFVKLFDPAVGTGTFLLEAIDFIHDLLVKFWRGAGAGDGEIADRWNDYVPRHLLPRLWGLELLPVPCFLARLHVALKLAQTGYRFDSPARIEIHLGNTLAGPSPPLAKTVTRSVSKGWIEPAYDLPFTVVLGNPPFSYLSENQSSWITSLVRGDNGHAGYFHVNGQKLAEKKTWLHDDYVKFLRYAQWRIESTGCGIIALVTNHGYLTNATFRILRQRLIESFPRISVLDLHGNRKAREVAPDGARDENVFGLDQGIAVGFFRRGLNAAEPRFEHAELWGSRQDKFHALDAAQITNLPRVPAPADFLFTPAGPVVHSEYAAAPPLTDLLPLHATAPVTARDHFVVAFTRGELRERIEAFRDLSIPDDEIRRRYFTRTRSPRYERGDTRGWKLAAARRTIAALDDWQSLVQPCQYRPLDWRWIFWHPAMIDWPRGEITQHFVARHSHHDDHEGERGRGGEGGNQLAALSPPLSLSPSLALIARRQLPPSEPATYFWATAALALDGIIRSDNRGSESLFLLDQADDDSARMACYAYALFHSPTYRQRYAAALRTSFPRVPSTRDQELTNRLADLGRQLVALHTQRPPQFVGWDKPASAGAGPPECTADFGGPARLATASRWSHPTAASQRLLLTVAPRFPRYDAGRIWIRENDAIAAADEATWQFRVGAHQVARKWLADRRGRVLTEADLAWYGVILDTIAQTRAIATAIDAAIDDHGGFPAAFRRERGRDGGTE